MKIEITCMNKLEIEENVWKECNTIMTAETEVFLRARMKCPSCGNSVIIAC